MPNVSKDMQLHQKPPTGLCGKLCSEASVASDKTEGGIRGVFGDGTAAV